VIKLSGIVPAYCTASYGSEHLYHVHRIICDKRRAWDGRGFMSSKERAWWQGHPVTGEKNWLSVSDSSTVA